MFDTSKEGSQSANTTSSREVDNTIDVTDGDVTETATVEATYEHRGDTFAKVVSSSDDTTESDSTDSDEASGDSLGGFVEMN